MKSIKEPLGQLDSKAVECFSVSGRRECRRCLIQPVVAPTLLEVTKALQCHFSLEAAHLEGFTR